MSCPKCGCKVTYQFDADDDCLEADGRLERCAACGDVFDIDDHADEDEDTPPDQAQTSGPRC
jgi:hypothetical protein